MVEAEAEAWLCLLTYLLYFTLLYLLYLLYWIEADTNPGLLSPKKKEMRTAED